MKLNLVSQESSMDIDRASYHFAVLEKIAFCNENGAITGVSSFLVISLSIFFVVQDRLLH